MSFDRLSRLHRSALHAGIVIWRTKAFWSRAFLCWLIGATVLLTDDGANFDRRFQLRPSRTPKAPVVLLEVSEREWADLADGGARRNVLRPLKEIVQVTDSYFWKASVWRHLLSRVLASEPAVIGISFYFGDEARPDRGDLSGREGSYAVFEDPRILWSAELDAAGRIAAPGLAAAYNRNVGLKTLRPDEDGILRRLYALPDSVPHLAFRLASAVRPKSTEDEIDVARDLIDFAGPSGTFVSYSFRDVLDGRVPNSAFAGKVVIVGPRDSGALGAVTPLGRMTRAETLANVVDDAYEGRWIERASAPWYLAALAGLLAVTLWIISSYPQSVALVFFCAVALAWTAASAWAFDARFFWLPVLAPLIQITATYIVFLSYQLTRNEQRAWRLEQDRRYSLEIDSLKNNFVSMMSHDLKTPIAKIQAIANRALVRTKETEAAEDLRELLNASDDLHRYIRSILQVTKLEAREFQIAREPIDVNDAIGRAVDRLKPLASAKHIQLECALEPMFSIEADPTLIQEVVHNLVENAIKYTPINGRVRVVSQETDDSVRISVEDTGPGIEKSEQTGIWGKFTRGRKHSEDAQGPSGSGLGLYLVKYFVELHGGRVFLESEVDRGTKIGFSIPMATDTTSSGAREFDGVG